MRILSVISISILAASSLAVPNGSPVAHVEKRNTDALGHGIHHAPRAWTPSESKKRAALAPDDRRLFSRALGPGVLVNAASHPNTIRALQWLLTARGAPTAADGKLGPDTERAVRAFQAAAGIAADGIAGPDTLGALVSSVQSGGVGDVVRAAQSALNAKRAGPEIDLDVDGDFGPATRAAAVAFQKASGLAQDGIVGPDTWTALFTGGPPPAPAPARELERVPVPKPESVPPPKTGYCRRINQAGVSLLEQVEGVRLVPYDDKTGEPIGSGKLKGNPTIGIGHKCAERRCLDVKEKYGIPLTKETAGRLLLDDIPRYTECLGLNLKRTVHLTDNQWAALTSMVFHEGCGTFIKREIFKGLNRGENPAKWGKKEFERLSREGESIFAGRRLAERDLFVKPSRKEAFPSCS